MTTVPRGGPTQHDYTTVPTDWSGLYQTVDVLEHWTIEIYTPRRGAEGRVTGFNHETVFYDADALVEPIRIVRNFEKSSGLGEGTPYAYIECIQTLYPVNGVPTPVSPGVVIEYRVPDMFGRPWAQTWELYHEEGMTRPEQEEVQFSFE